MKRVRNKKSDSEQAEEENSELIADFTKIDPRGVPISKIIEALEQDGESRSK